MSEYEPKREDNKPIDRVLGEVGLPDLVSHLDRLEPRDMQTLLLKVFSKRTKRIDSAAVMARYNEKYRYLGGSELSQKEILFFDTLLYSVIPDDYFAIEFSPTGPLGTNAALTKLSQDIIPSTIRNSEVVSDPTVMLALEAARRRKMLIRLDPNNNEQVKICTSSRVLRLQPFDARLGYMQHFRLFGVLSTGRNDYYQFLKSSLIEHISIYLNFIEKLNSDKFSIKDVTVYFSDIRIMDKLISDSHIDGEVIRRSTQKKGFNPFREFNINIPDRIAIDEAISLSQLEQYGITRNWNFLTRIKDGIKEPLAMRYQDVKFGFDLSRPAGVGYYPNFCFHIYGTNENGLTLQLADGGFTDWMKILTSNGRELCMASGFGSELVNKMFRKKLK